MSPAPHPPCRALIFGTSNSNCPNCRWALGPNFNAKDSDMQKYYNLQNMHIKPGNVEINWRLKRIFVKGFSQQPFLKALTVFIHFDEVLVFQQNYAWYTYKSASDLTWPTGHVKFVCVATGVQTQFYIVKAFHVAKYEFMILWSWSLEFGRSIKYYLEGIFFAP